MSAELAQPSGGAPDLATVGPVEVTGESIAEFADALGDPHPVYRSAAAARERGHPDVIAPPTFAVRLAAQAEASVLARRPLGYDYASAVHLAQDYRHVRPIRKGDVLTASARLVQAREALGGGLVSVEVTISAQDGSTVTVSTAQVLSRRPASEVAPEDGEDPTGDGEDPTEDGEDPTEDGEDPTEDDEDGQTPYQALAEFIGREDFICLGAKAALRRGGVLHRHCGELGSPSAVLDSLAGLGDFLESFEPGERSFSSFVATFDSLPDTAEQAFEDAVWGHLQGMHDRDSRRHAWNGQYDSDPASPRFAFSVQGHPFFVVGLHPGASRPSRRFRLPALVFNSQLQFNAMGRNFFRMRKKIRQRDLAFNGSANPSLLTYRDEARHYSGRMTAPGWGCPFTPRNGGNARGTMAG